jgi:hypothetical protein
MNSALSPPRHLPAGLNGLLLALVALAMQLAAFGIVPFSGAGAGVDRLLATSICHSEAADRGGVPAPHHAPACVVCPLCQAIAHGGAILASPMAAFVAPVLVVTRAFAQPPARAPPSLAASPATARGPPATL